MDRGEVLLLAAVVLIPAAILWLVFLARSGKTGRPAVLLGIPHALRPGQPDEVLEGRRLERIQWGWFWAIVATAVFIPLYWLPEAQRQASFEERFNDESVERGRLIFASAPELPEEAEAAEFKEIEKQIALGQGCANCHGAPETEETEDLAEVAGGGVANPCPTCPVDEETGQTLVQYRAPPLQNVFQRWDEEIIRFTIERGRPGTPMPAWSVEYGGSMTEQSISDVIAWLKTLPGNQNPPADLSAGCSPPEEEEGATDTENPPPLPAYCGAEIFEARCAVCHGPDGQGKEEEPDNEVLPGEVAESVWYPGMALWKGDVRHLPKGNQTQNAAITSHVGTITNGRRFQFMPAFGEAPVQGIPVPPYPLTRAQILAVMRYERTL